MFLLLSVGWLHCGAATQVIGVYEREEDAFAEPERHIKAIEKDAESIWQQPRGWEYMADDGLRALEIHPLSAS